MTKKASVTEHKKIAKWVAGSGGRQVKIRCTVVSCVWPMPDEVEESIRDQEGTYWEVKASVGKLGMWGRDLAGRFLARVLFAM